MFSLDHDFLSIGFWRHLDNDARRAMRATCRAFRGLADEFSTHDTLKIQLEGPLDVPSSGLPKLLQRRQHITKLVLVWNTYWTAADVVGLLMQMGQASDYRMRSLELEVSGQDVLLPWTISILEAIAAAFPQLEVLSVNGELSVPIYYMPGWQNAWEGLPASLQAISMMIGRTRGHRIDDFSNPAVSFMLWKDVEELSIGSDFEFDIGGIWKEWKTDKLHKLLFRFNDIEPTCVPFFEKVGRQLTGLTIGHSIEDTSLVLKHTPNLEKFVATYMDDAGMQACHKLSALKELEINELDPDDVFDGCLPLPPVVCKINIGSLSTKALTGFLVQWPATIESFHIDTLWLYPVKHVTVMVNEDVSDVVVVEENVTDVEESERKEIEQALITSLKDGAAKVKHLHVSTVERWGGGGNDDENVREIKALLNVKM